MANPEHLHILQQGVAAWNQWREQNEGIKPDLAGTDLARANFGGANLHRAGLRLQGFSLVCNLTQSFQVPLKA